MKTFRPDKIKALSRSKEFLEKKKNKGTITDDDIYAGLILEHLPSLREMAYVYMPIQVEQTGEPNHFSMTQANNQRRTYNKDHPHNQEFVSLWTEVHLPNGKIGKRSLLQIAAGENTNIPISLTESRMRGDDAKLERLREKKRNGKKIRVSAARLKARIYS